MNWTFQAHDVKSGRMVLIDQNWQHWPARDPLHNELGFFRPSDCDERLYRAPDGDYVLVWRGDVFNPDRFDCDYMPAPEATAWFAKQGIEPPDALSPRPVTAPQPPAAMDHRTLWELGQRIAPVPATAAADGAAPQAGDFVELPNGDIGLVESVSYPAPEPATDQAESATEAPSIEAAVGPATESKAVVEAKRLWTREEAQPIVAAHLARHPHATLAETSAATGISKGTIGNTRAWRIEAKKRKRQKQRRQSGGRTAISFEKVERMIGRTSDVEAEALIAECAANPELLEAIESQHDDMAADASQRRRSRRPTA